MSYEKGQGRDEKDTGVQAVHETERTLEERDKAQDSDNRE
jgi:hypothetical protein